MLIRCRTRRAVSIFCLMALPGLAIAADEVNPFARWESLKQQTGITDSGSLERPTASGASLEYFSPNSKSEKPAATKTASPKRLKPLESEAVGAPQTPRADNVVTPAPTAKPVADKVDAAWPASFQVHRSNGQGEAPKPRGGVIRAAAVSSQTGDSTDSNIQLVNKQQAFDDEINPFAEFVEAAPPTVAAATVAAPTAAPPTRIPERAAAASPQVDVPRSGAVNPASPSHAFGGVLPSEDTGAQSPVVTLEWVQHEDFNLGQECRCDLLIRNTGECTVRNVTAEAAIPDGLQVIDAQPAPSSTAGSASWVYDELQAGESRRVELTVVPLGRGGMQMNGFVRFTGFSTSVFTVQEPMLKLAVDGPSQVEVGQQISYVVSVNNPGTGVARNVTIQAAIPEGLEHRHGSLLTIEVGTLNPGESRQAKLSVAAIAGGLQDLAVRATADGELTDQYTTNVTVAEPQLSIAVRGPQERITGQETDYELVVLNDGNVASNNVRAKYRVPEGYDFINADRGGKYLETDRTIDWFVGTLMPGESGSFRVTLSPTATGTAVHQAGVVSEHGKVTMGEHSTTVQGVAELSLTVAARQRKVNVGEEAVFEVRIENKGSRAADGVGVSCELPTGLELLQAAGPSEYIAENGVLVFRSVPTLEPGQAAVYAIQARCRREGAHNLRVRVASATIKEPLIGEETATAVSR